VKLANAHRIGANNVSQAQTKTFLQNFTRLIHLTSVKVCQTLYSRGYSLLKTDLKSNSWQSFNMSSFIAGLDEAEAFGDTELMAEFSLLSVVQNLQQGKMSTDLLETLEVKQEFRTFFSHSHMLVSTS